MRDMRGSNDIGRTAIGSALMCLRKWVTQYRCVAQQARLAVVPARRASIGLLPDLALFLLLQNGILRPPEAGLAGDFFGIGRGRGGLWCNVRGSREISPGDPPPPLFVLACSDGDNSKGGGGRGRRCSSTTASRCACQRQLKAPGRSTCRKGDATGGRWADG